MKKDVTDKELMALYRARVRDTAQSKTKRRVRSEALPQPFGDLLGEYFKKDSSALRKIEESRAIMAWPSIVGDTAARYSSAEKFRGDTLIVKVTDPLWMQQLLLLKQDILRKYRQAHPRIGLRDLYFSRR